MTHEDSSASVNDGNAPTKPVQPRQLGRSRSYARADLPTRLGQWHAPRANRWERLCVLAGGLEVQWLEPGGVTCDHLRAGEGRWIGPGTRWRVAGMDETSRFELEIHADDATPINMPPMRRAAWLDDVEALRPADEAALMRLLLELAPGGQRLVRGEFDVEQALLRDVIALCGQSLFWHPLEGGSGRFAAFVARADGPIGLLEYLGRDHAVIEATMAGAMRGEAERRTWLRSSLSRHVAIEEGLLFPAYLDAGGRAGWISGLCSEHVHLRHYLDALSEPLGQRRFLLLLDGHDEKEERIVYPDMLVRLAARADELTRAAMLFPVPPPAG